MTRLLAALWRFDGAAADRGLVAAMLDAMRPAGAAWAAETLAEGRGAVGAASAEPEGPVPPPQIAARAGWLVAGDVRLMDGGALARALGEADASDHIAAARAVTAGGAEGAARIRGDAALVALAPGEGRLLALRDVFGIRPLFLAHRPGAYLALASHPRAFLETGLAAPELDPETVANFPLALQPVAPATLFRTIRSLAPAHLLEAGAEGPDPPRRYWQPALPAPIPLSTDPAEVAARLRGRLETAVARRLPDRGPTAAHLSGGLDSSTVAAIAARARPPAIGLGLVEAPLPSGLEPVSEGALAREVAAASGIRFIGIASAGPLARLDGPADPATGALVGMAVPEIALLARAAGEGATAVLSGWGGDQLVSARGTEAAAELALAGAWSRLAAHLGHGRPGAATVLARARSEVLMALLPAPLRRALRRLRAGEAADRAHARLVAGLLRLEIRAFLSPIVTREGADGRRNRLAELTHPLVLARIEAAQLAAQSIALELRFPLLDRDLVDEALRIPSAFLFRERIQRRAMRDAAAGLLPERVRWLPAKRIAFPAEGLRFARDREGLERLAARLARDPAVARHLDIAALAPHLAAIRPEEEVMREIEAATRAGRQPEGIPVLLESVIAAARAIEAASARWGCGAADGREAGPR